MYRPSCLAALRRTLRFCVFLLAAIALAAPLAFGGVNRCTTSGPFWGGCSSLAILGADYEYDFYYATNSQLYKSTDGGATWSQSFTGLPIREALRKMASGGRSRPEF